METRIRELRHRRGWTLKALADRLSTTPQTVQRLETGAVTLSTDWLERFARAFGVSPAELIGGGDRPGIELLGELGRNGQLHAKRQEAERFSIDVPAIQPVAVRVSEPIGPYPRGSILIGNRLEGLDMAGVRSCDALVALDHGVILLRRVIRSGTDDRFILVPFSAEDDVSYDVAPHWIARLVMRIDYL
ncbi:helix-turn-helix domain-containing protein [Rhodoligotrophos ferricapiens]|uniref:helix-turn-helix domain-containing protein n=1 Tax=Rhodoligotrophos ferricapiens TaxID=3069264 RepID=UPI00315CD431